LQPGQATARVSLAANAFPLLPSASPAMKLRLLLKSQAAPIDIPVTRPQRLSAQRMEATLLRAGIDTVVNRRDDIVTLLVMFSVDGNSYQSVAVAQPRLLFAAIKPVTPATTPAPSGSTTASSRSSTDYWLPLMPLVLVVLVTVVVALYPRNRNRVYEMTTSSSQTGLRTNPVSNLAAVLRDCANDNIHCSCFTPRLTKRLMMCRALQQLYPKTC